MNGITRGRSRIAALFAACALAHGCMADTGVEEPIEGTGEALEIVPENYDPTFLCDYRMEASAGYGTLQFPYCATKDLGSARGFRGYKRLIIAQHGRGSRGRDYLSTLNTATWYAISRDNLFGSGETFVIAPQFIQPKFANAAGIPGDELDDLFVWGQGGVEWDWAVGGHSYRIGAPGSRSSIELLEQLVSMAIARMPDLEEIIFVGQSAGGIFTQRYAALNTFEFPPGVHVRYVPANSWGWVYPTEERPLLGGGFGVPNLLADDEDLYPDTQVCQTDAYAVCSDYDDYARGLSNLPPSHWVSQQLLVDVAGAYAERDVSYLASEADIIHAEQCSACGDQLQGEHVRQRAQLFSEYMRTHLGASSHQVFVVPDMGHGRDMLKEPCGRAAIFGAPHVCNPMGEHTVGSGWTGSIVSIAYGNVDDDPAEEIAVVEHRNFTTRVLVLDDRDHGHDVLFEPSAGWGWSEPAEDVAFGDVDGDGRDELAVARSTFSGDSWFVYRRLDNGSWPIVDSGGAEWAYPRSARHVAFGDMDGDGDEELAVTRNATSGTRWYVYRYAAGGILIGDPDPMVQVESAGWEDGVRPTDIAFGDVDGDGNDELAVSRDAESGARMYVYQLDAPWYVLPWGIGGGWRTGHVIRHIALGDADRDGKDEIILARDVYPGYSRWVVLDDGAASYDVLLQGGRDSDAGWVAGATVSALAFGRLTAGSLYPAFGVAATGPGGPVLELATFQMFDEELVIGDYERPSIPGGAEIGALAFGDADGLGGDDIAYGVANTSEAGYGVRVLPAP